MKYFFLHPFLYFILSIECFVRSKDKNQNMNVDDNRNKFLCFNFTKLYIKELVKMTPYSLYKIENGIYYFEHEIKTLNLNQVSLSQSFSKYEYAKNSKINKRMGMLVEFLENNIQEKYRDSFLKLLNRKFFFVSSEQNNYTEQKKNEIEKNYMLRIYSWMIKHGISYTAYDALQKFPEHHHMISLNRFSAFFTHFYKKIELFYKVETIRDGVKGVFLEMKAVLAILVLILY
jgi:hypothetical protein